MSDANLKNALRPRMGKPWPNIVEKVVSGLWPFLLYAKMLEIALEGPLRIKAGKVVINDRVGGQNTPISSLTE